MALHINATKQCPTPTPKIYFQTRKFCHVWYLQPWMDHVHCWRGNTQKSQPWAKPLRLSADKKTWTAWGQDFSHHKFPRSTSRQHTIHVRFFPCSTTRTWSIRFQLLTSPDRSGASRVRPALLMSTSTPPCSASMRWNMPTTSSSFVTSQWKHAIFSLQPSASNSAVSFWWRERNTHTKFSTLQNLGVKTPQCDRALSFCAMSLEGKSVHQLLKLKLFHSVASRPVSRSACPIVSPQALLVACNSAFLPTYSVDFAILKNDEVKNRPWDFPCWCRTRWRACRAWRARAPSPSRCRCRRPSPARCAQPSSSCPIPPSRRLTRSEMCRPEPVVVFWMNWLWVGLDKYKDQFEESPQHWLIEI